MKAIVETLLTRPHFLVFIVLFIFGLYIMMIHKNLIKKLIGMYLVQTSVFIFYVTLGVKANSTVPILLMGSGPIRAEDYANPLPHVLMLTAIVVGVATLGVSLALVIAIYKKYHTLEEDELFRRLE